MIFCIPQAPKGTISVDDIFAVKDDGLVRIVGKVFLLELLKFWMKYGTVIFRLNYASGQAKVSLGFILQFWIVINRGINYHFLALPDPKPVHFLLPIGVVARFINVESVSPMHTIFLPIADSIQKTAGKYRNRVTAFRHMSHRLK